VLGLSVHPGILSSFGYSRPYDPALEVVVPEVDTTVTWASPLTAGVLSWRKIQSAFGWSYSYNPADEVTVPAVDYEGTWANVLDLAPYPVGSGLPGGLNFGDTGALSAFMYPHAYNPSSAAVLGDIRAFVGVDFVDSALGFPEPHNLADEVSVPAAYGWADDYIEPPSPAGSTAPVNQFVFHDPDAGALYANHY